MSTTTPAQTAVRKIAATPIKYSTVDKCFTLDGRRKRGLTGLLQEVMPVPQGEIEADEAPRKKARRSKNDPQPSPIVWRSTNENAYFMKKAVGSCRDCTLQCELERDDDPQSSSTTGRNFHMKHGSMVDEQIKLRVLHGREVLETRNHGALKGGLDPCVATLFDYLRAEKQRVIATQGPLYSPTLDCATAFDIITDDGAIYEVKSTTVVGEEAIERNDRNYETPRARVQNTALRGTPCSQYGIGQLQLHVTRSMIHETTGWEPPKAAVLRVSPGVVRRYDLNPWFKSRAEKFHRAIAQRTGQDKRNKRLKRHQQPAVATTPRR